MEDAWRPNNLLTRFIFSRMAQNIVTVTLQASLSYPFKFFYWKFSLFTFQTLSPSLILTQKPLIPFLPPPASLRVLTHPSTHPFPPRGTRISLHWGIEPGRRLLKLVSLILHQLKLHAYI